MFINNVTTYKFRAECTADAQAARAVFHPWILNWQEVRATLEHEGVVYGLPDVDVEFTLVDGAPALGEMLWLLDGIDNCHVVADTLDTLENYTGDRKFRERFGGQAQRPRKEIISQASTAIRSRQKVLNTELERALQTHKTYDAASRAGDKWQPFPESEPSPGWIVPVPNQENGMIALRRISAPMGCKNWQKKGDAIVKVRLFTIGT